MAFAGVLGLLIGSFLNVVIWRVPRGESIVSPPSACPRCGRRISARDNIPLVSWMLLRGRCRSCREGISWRYPLVELGTAILFAAVTLRFGATLTTPAFAYLAAIAIALGLIDLDVHRLPNVIVLPAYPTGAALLALASWGSADWYALTRAAIGGAVLYSVYFALMVGSSLLLGRTGMAFGDVKLAGVLGMYMAWLGWGPLVVGSFAAFLLGGVFSIALLALHVADRKTQVPFGPWMLLGAAVGIVAGESLWSAYLGLMI